MFLNSALHIIHHMISSISAFPSMRIPITAIVAAAAAVIAQLVAATPRSAFASSEHTSAHIPNSDAVLSTSTTDLSPSGPPAAPLRSLLRLHNKEGNGGGSGATSYSPYALSLYDCLVAVIVGPVPTSSSSTNDNKGDSSDLRVMISAMYNAGYEEAILEEEG